MRRIYMDANATTPLLPEVFEAMRPYFIEHFGNASSIHQPGQQARAAVEQARESVARLLHCRPSEIVFTSGGTESDNLALFGVLEPGDHLITTRIEHHAVLHAAEALRDRTAPTGHRDPSARLPDSPDSAATTDSPATPDLTSPRGIDVTFLPCTSEGLIEPATLAAAIRPNTRLVSVLMANNETGVIQPISELAAIAHRHGALFHTDAVQAAGKLPLDTSKSGDLAQVDLLSISGHKLYAPQGTGVLFCRRNVRLAPLFFGGSHERQRRPGTENLAGIVGLGKASELAQSWLGSPAPAALAALRDRLEQGILAAVEDSGINGWPLPRVANTTNLYFDHVEAEALVIALDLKGLAVSGGSACQSGATEPSHVLTAMGLSPARARASVRFSLSRLTTADEIDYALEIVPAAVARLRTLSPASKQPAAALA